MICKGMGTRGKNKFIIYSAQVYIGRETSSLTLNSFSTTCEKRQSVEEARANGAAGLGIAIWLGSESREEKTSEEVCLKRATC